MDGQITRLLGSGLCDVQCADGVRRPPAWTCIFLVVEGCHWLRPGDLPPLKVSVPGWQGQAASRIWPGAWKSSEGLGFRVINPEPLRQVPVSQICW